MNTELPQHMHESIQWGVSCVCVNEQQMGVVIATMTLLGCTNIAWQPIRTKKNPAAVRRGKKGGRPKGRRTAKRMSPSATAAQFTSKHATFTTQQFTAWMAKRGFNHKAASNALYSLKVHKKVRRVGDAKYQTIAIVAKAA